MRSRTRTVSLLLAVACFAATAVAQQPRIPIRAVTPPSATSTGLLKSIDELREIAGGKVLVNAGSDRELLVLDASLEHATALADTLGTVAVYPRAGKLISYLADSSLFYESDSRSLLLIDPQGKLGRVVALPHPQDFNLMTNGGLVGTDSRGRLVYQGRRSVVFPGPRCTLGDAARPAPQPVPTDSVAILRADFETRGVDTIGRAKTVIAGLTFPITNSDANCNVVSAKVRVNPSIPPTDSWTITSRGAVAIVRSHDYHIDWINADGTTRSTPKLPYDWRRLTDADKQAKIDSARKIIDSLTAVGGYRMQACGGGRSMSFNTNPPAPGDGPPGSGGGAGGGRGLGGGSGGGSAGAVGGRGGDAPAVGVGPSDCQTLTVTAEFVPLDSMTDYIAPIRERSARADLDGNVWILPTTSAGAQGGLLYDVVNSNGELVERVQLPANRDIAGFGRGGVLYLQRGDYKTGFAIERVKIIR